MLKKHLMISLYISSKWGFDRSSRHSFYKQVIYVSEDILNVRNVKESPVEFDKAQKSSYIQSCQLNLNRQRFNLL